MSAHTQPQLTVPVGLQSVAALAVLLEKLERAPRQASAGQFQQVAQQLSRMLVTATPGPALDALLQALPAAAELYENAHYAHAGLCRSPLTLALDTELAASACIRRARGLR